MSVEQLVNAAVEVCLDGTRVWDPKAVDLGGFLRGVIRSLASSERKKEFRAKTYATQDMSKHFEPLDSAEDDVVGEENRRSILATVEECIGDDADLRALYLAILEGHTKREELAAVLNWKADRVTAARIKLQRRLIRAAPERFAATRERQRRSP
jgi:hypothetical protein